jgi:hypothetical protein
LFLPSLFSFLETEKKPMLSFRVTTAKLFIELASYENSVKVLEGLLDEMDEEVEIWYLLGLSHFFLKQASLAHECLGKATAVRNSR